MVRAMDKFSIYDRIDDSLQRWRGDVRKVQIETGYPLDYIRNVMHQLRKKRDEEVAKSVAELIYEKMAGCLLSALEHYDDMLFQFAGRIQLIVSMCCEAPLGVTKDGQLDRKLPPQVITKECYCMLCGAGTDVKTLDRVNIADLELRIIKERQDIFNQVIDCAKKLGFIAVDVVQPPPGDQAPRQNIMVFQDASGTHKQIVDDFSKLDPMDAERVSVA